MQYTKPALTFDQQLEKLISRGLKVLDRSKALKILEMISYYRLSAYFIPFQQQKDKFKDNITFEDVYSLYELTSPLKIKPVAKLIQEEVFIVHFTN